MVDRPDLRIIDPETFEQAQQIMKSRGKAFKVDKERQSNKYLFSTLIKCKECGLVLPAHRPYLQEHLYPLGLLRPQRAAGGQLPQRRDGG